MKNRLGAVLQDLVGKHAENPNLSRVNQCGFRAGNLAQIICWNCKDITAKVGKENNIGGI